MKNIKVRHIIGTLAIIAIAIMNFTYAHNNYNIANMSNKARVAATTAAPTYREELEIEYQFCYSYACDVTIYGKYTFGTHTITFYSKSMKGALSKAEKYAQEVNEAKFYYAEVNQKCYITKSYTEAYRVNCLNSGNLNYCQTKDAICEPLEYESSLNNE